MYFNFGNLTSKGDRIIIKESEKTEQPAVIPYWDDHFLKPVRIVSKYMSAESDYIFRWFGKEEPNIKSVNHKVNKVIEEIGKEIKCPFRLSTKIGRKTFATYAIVVLKMDKTSVMRITGHTTEDNFNRYLGFDEDAVIEAYREKAKFMKVG